MDNTHGDLAQLRAQVAGEYEEQTRAAMANLQVELESVHAQLEEANDEKIKAAQCGLLALEEKQQLQQQFDELESAHSSTRKELDSTLQLLEDLQRDRDRREQQEESLRSSLAAECERRENLLVDNNSELQDQVNYLRQTLGKETERRQTAETELRQLREREHDHLRANHSGVDRALEAERLHEKSLQEVDQLQGQLSLLEGVQARASNLEKTMASCEAEKDNLSELVNRLNQELEQSQVDVSMAFASLKEEQERCRHLEMKMEEMEMASSFSAGLGQSTGNVMNELTMATMSTPEPADDVANGLAGDPDNMMPSVPITPGRNASLLDEIQNSMESNQYERVAELEQQLETHNSTIADLKAELQRTQLKDSIALQGMRKETQEKQHAIDRLQSELAELRPQMNEAVCVGEERLSTTAASKRIQDLQSSIDQLQKDIAHEREALEKANQTLEQKGEDVSGEHSNLLKRIERMEAERATRVLDSEEKCEKLRIDLFNVREDNDKLLAMRTELEQKNADIETRFRSAENSSAEQRESLSALSREIQNAIADVEGTARLAASLTNGQGGGDSLSAAAGSHAATSPSKVSMEPGQLMNTLRDKVRAIKSNVESVLRSSLEKHTVTTGNPTATTAGSSAAQASAAATDKEWTNEGKKQAQLKIERMRRELKSRANEISTLRMVMQANRSTAQAALQREKAIAERKVREAEERVVRARADLERTQRDNSNFTVMRSMFAERCEEYIKQVASFRKTIAELTKEKGELSMLLERAIAQKVRLTEKLEEYEIENERMWSIPQALAATRV
eukprot:scpid37486/ scgid8064/ Protein bicaudal D homolog 1